MRILLIQPGYRSSELPTYFPLGLAYIVSVLREAGHTLQVLDIEGNRLSQQEVERFVSSAEFDAVGVSALITKYKYLKRELIPLLKARNPNAPVVLGNSIATSVPEMCVDRVGADVAVIDEGETTAVELFDVLEKRGGEERLLSVDGIAFRKKEGVVARTKPRKFIENLDTIPFPAWDLFPTDIYAENFALQHAMFIDPFKPIRGINVSSVRGCPFSCNFCYKVFGRSARWRSIDNLVAEVKELQRRYKIQYVSFSDDLFTANRKRVEEFCDRMIKENMGVKFFVSARVTTVDQDILNKMAKAGVVSITYGIESASEIILKNMNKMITRDAAYKAVVYARKAGISPNPSFMIGYPGETAQTVQETVDFCAELGLASEFFFTTPYPGTRLYEQAKAMGKIPDDDKFFESLGEMSENLLVNFTDMSDEDIRRLKSEGDSKTRKSQLGKLLLIGQTLGPGKMLNAAMTRAVCKTLRMMKKRSLGVPKSGWIEGGR